MKTKSKVNLTIGAFGVLIILMVVFILAPFLRKISVNSKELASQRENLAVLETKAANLEKFKNLYSGLREILEKIDDLFVSAEVPVGFIGFLEDTSSESNLTIKIVPSSQETKGDAWPSLSFQITNTGSFDSFLKFLEKLENSPYLIEIKNVNIGDLPEKEALPGWIKATFSLKVFAK